MYRIILSTGGTGGHIFPALAVAEALKETCPDIELLFVGATYGPEGKLAEAAHIPFAALPGRGILGKGLRAIPAAINNLRSIWQAIRLMRKFKPSAVAAFGGYACFAPALAACLCKYPLLLHEQNAIAGASIRLLAKRANTVCVSLPQTTGIDRPIVLTGNPVRGNVRMQEREIARQGKNLLILGGSQGAHAINESIIALLPSLKAHGVKIMHQTGEKDYAHVREEYMVAGYDPACVKPFINNMGEAYNWADLAVCRAGASTVAELCIAAVPSILVPFPAAIHDHQTRNAQIAVNAGAAVLLPENRIGDLKDAILDLFSNSQRLAEMSLACARLARPEAASLVAGEILKLCELSNS